MIQDHHGRLRVFDHDKRPGVGTKHGEMVRLNGQHRGMLALFSPPSSVAFADSRREWLSSRLLHAHRFPNNLSMNMPCSYLPGPPVSHSLIHPLDPRLRRCIQLRTGSQGTGYDGRPKRLATAATCVRIRMSTFDAACKKPDKRSRCTKCFA